MRLCGLRRNFCPSLNYPELFKLGFFFPRMRIITRDKFCLRDPSVWQVKHLIIQHLLFFLSFYELPFSPWKPYSLAQGGIYTSFHLSVFEPLMYGGGSSRYKIKFVFLLLICLMLIIQPSERLFEG